MPRRLFLALLLLVAAPMVLLGWMSASAVKSSQASARESLAKLLSSQLSDADQKIAQLFADYAMRLDQELDSADPIAETLRRLRREVPIVRQGILVDRSGVMRFPGRAEMVDVDATEVAASLPGMIDARPVMAADSDSSSSNPHPAAQTNLPAMANAAAQQLQSPAKERPVDVPPQNSATAQNRVDSQSQSNGATATWRESAWQQWYMADGAQVVYWRSRDDGFSVGVLLERSRWIADLIAALPDQRVKSQPNSPRQSFSGGETIRLADQAPTPIGRISLVDEASRTVYRWGDLDEFQGPPLASTPLSPPLASWQLRLHVNQALIPRTSPVPMYLSLGGIALVLLSIGGYVLSSVHRQIRAAKSRVNFAGQVSHELRTPLTNIRLYTELAQSDLKRVASNDASVSLSRRLDVIDHESRRLQRLVSGVLEMIRPSGKPIGVRSQLTDVCGLISGIARQFAPSFDAAEITLQTQCDCVDDVSIDPDILEMVLVNLLSNVEKYVPRGGRCTIECDRINDEVSPHSQLRVVIADDGPGIAPKHREKVFRPFERVDDSIHAPSGTGIGLTIARRAAARHGGNLRLLSASPLGGAAFELTLPIQSTASQT